ncbi:MAG: histidine kinase [Bacteroidia bacterium]
MKQTFILFVCLLYWFESSGQKKELDSILNGNFRIEQSDTSRLRALDNFVLYNWSPPFDTLRRVTFLELHMAEKSGQLLFQNYALFSLANMSYQEHDFPKALEYSQRALKGCDQLRSKSNSKNERMIASCYEVIESVYWQISDIAKVMEYNLKATKIYEELNDRNATIMKAIVLGNMYYNMKEYSSAMKFYLKELPIVEQIAGNKAEMERYTAETYQPFDDLLVEIYGDMALTYGKLDKPDLSLKYHLLELSIGERMKLCSNLSEIYANQAEYYLSQADYKHALYHAFKALKVAKERKEVDHLRLAYSNLAWIYDSLKNYKLATQYGDSSLKQVVNIMQRVEVKKRPYEIMADACAKSGKMKEAYAFLMDLKKINENVFGQEKTKELNDLRIANALEKQESDLKAKAEADMVIAKEQEKARAMVLYITAGALLILLFFGALIYRIQLKKKKGIERAEVNRKIADLKLMALKAQMNPHFIFNCIASIQHFIWKNNPEDADRYLSKFSKLMRNVLMNSSQEYIGLQTEIQTLELYIELERLRFSSKFELSMTFEEEMDLKALQVPPMIIQPYVENAIWHGLMHLQEKTGMLNIRMKMRGNFLICLIEDNGIGRKKSMEIRRVKKHRSVGLSITKERLETLNSLHKNNLGVVITDNYDENGLASGTTVEICIPVQINSSEQKDFINTPQELESEHSPQHKPAKISEQAGE